MSFFSNAIYDTISLTFYLQYGEVFVFHQLKAISLLACKIHILISAHFPFFVLRRLGFQILDSLKNKK